MIYRYTPMNLQVYAHWSTNIYLQAHTYILIKVSYAADDSFHILLSILELNLLKILKFSLFLLIVKNKNHGLNTNSRVSRLFGFSC